jgi:hypothetical protein
MVARDGIGLPIAAVAAYRTGYPNATASILEIADAAEGSVAESRGRAGVRTLVGCVTHRSMVGSAELATAPRTREAAAGGDAQRPDQRIRTTAIFGSFRTRERPPCRLDSTRMSRRFGATSGMGGHPCHGRPRLVLVPFA